MLNEAESTYYLLWIESSFVHYLFKRILNQETNNDVTEVLQLFIQQKDKLYCV